MLWGEGGGGCVVRVGVVVGWRLGSGLVGWRLGVERLCFGVRGGGLAQGGPFYPLPSLLLLLTLYEYVLAQCFLSS